MWCSSRDVAAFDCHSSSADSPNYGFSFGGCGSLLGLCDIAAAECGQNLTGGSVRVVCRISTS